MQVETIKESSFRTAMDKVRDLLGPDAVILSSKQTKSGIEITAANDFPSIERFNSSNELVEINLKLEQFSRDMQIMQSMLFEQFADFSWKKHKNLLPIQSKAFSDLLNLGFASNIAYKIAQNINFDKNIDIMLQLQNWLQDNLIIKNMSEMRGVFCFVGSSGSGKTINLVRCALRYAMSFNVDAIAIIAIDAGGIGELDKLQAFGKILNIPIRIVKNKSSFDQAISNCNSKDLILIDTPAIDLHNLENYRHQVEFCLNHSDVSNILMLPSNISYVVAQKILNSFDQYKIDSCILTKLDETDNLGQCLSAIIKNNLMLSFYSIGNNIPNDLLIAKADYLVKAVLNGKSNKNEYINVIKEFTQELLDE